MYKFVELINFSSIELLSDLAIYTYKAFKKRHGELFFQLTIICSFTLIILLYVFASLWKKLYYDIISFYPKPHSPYFKASHSIEAVSCRSRLDARTLI